MEIGFNLAMPTESQITAAHAGATIAVTGATGFVGRAVVKQLLEAGYRDVVAIARKAPSVPLATDGVIFRAADISNSAETLAVLADCQMVIHLIGIIRPTPRQSFQKAHVAVTENVVFAMRKLGIRRLVHMSALGTRAGAASTYHRTKWVAEQMILKSKLDATIIRPALIIGAGGEFTKMLDAWSGGSVPPFFFMPYFGRGLLGQTGANIAPVRVEDVAKLFQWCLDRPVSIGKLYELSGRRQFTWPEFLRLYALTHHGRRRVTLAIPGWLGKILGQLPGLPFTTDQVVMAMEDSITDGATLKTDMPDFFSHDVF